MTSRRELYAHGEPFGDSATRRKIDGKGYVCGFGGDSSSSTKNETNNFDNRTAVQSGVGLSNSSGNTINVLDGGIVGRSLDTVDRTVNRTLNTVDLSTIALQNTVDKSLAASNNALSSALATSSSALNSALAASSTATSNSLKFADSQIGKALQTVDATMGDGFKQLLEIGAGLFDQGNKLIDKTQTTVAGAYADAQNTAKGTIDNRTTIILALAVAATIGAVVIFRKRG